MLKGMIKYPDQNNFDEAMAVISDCYKTEEPSFELQKVLNDDRCDIATRDDFWLFACGLKRFFAKHQRLPVSGSVPDMVSTTEWY